MASPTCTAPREGWKPEAAFKKDLEAQGYRIKNFKVTKGNCYEIYGTDKAGKKVEIYFDPVSGKALEQK
ncbi:MAG: PepSY domain-containing protein [Hydrogenophaga sp.]|uniref:PepSY domain-containing protein n=1 Tax=Hydrogenophaga sp. TaxID=1904254 RepID=UPI003D1338CE